LLLVSGLPAALPAVGKFESLGIPVRKSGLMGCIVGPNGRGGEALYFNFNQIGGHLFLVQVDPDTGEVVITRYACVDDVGRCINPLIVDGQTHGAIVQGVGQAMWEHVHFDPASGQPLSGSLMDYGMPRADLLPSFTTHIAEVLSPTNPLGIKAGGEGGTTAAPAVIVSAIVDALRDFGVRDIKMPATPYRIWKLIRDGKGAG